MRILVVEDDSLLADGLTQVLKRSGHAVDQVRTGLQADNSLRLTSYELVVLDVGLPGIDGFEVLRRLRSRRSKANVLVLTARDGVEDRVRGLDLGADDYLTKPFALAELVARIRALIRRASVDPIPTLVIGEVTIDTAARTVCRGGRPVELTPREYTVFE